jgi:hypothetical protein
MKFIWNEPPRGKPPYHQFPAGVHWQEAILGWLHYKGVWPEKNEFERHHWQIEYNYVWHFYDIYIYECWLPRCAVESRGRAISQMREYLKGSGLDWQEHATHTWDAGKLRPGVRFWIQAEDYPREARAKPDPAAWKGCIAWSQVPGCNHACFDMCSPEQREACKTNGNAELRGTKGANHG